MGVTAVSAKVGGLISDSLGAQVPARQCTTTTSRGRRRSGVSYEPCRSLRIRSGHARRTLLVRPTAYKATENLG
jgi:hypothetical protein